MTAKAAHISPWDTVDEDMLAWMIHQMGGGYAGSEMTIFSLSNFLYEDKALKAHGIVEFIVLNLLPVNHYAKEIL